MVARPYITGMKEIAKLVGFSEPTILGHKRQYPGMPINLAGGVWVGDPDALLQFYKDVGKGETEKYLTEPPAPRSNFRKGDKAKKETGDEQAEVGEEGNPPEEGVNAQEDGKDENPSSE